MTIDPVIVHYDPAARTGNRMFMYAFGAILALQRGSSLFHDAIPELGIPSRLWKDAVNVAPIKGTYICTRWMGDHFVDDSIWTYDGPIIVNSFLQKYRYYEKHKVFCQNMFNISLGPTIYKDSLVVHYRGTDYISINCDMAYEVYKEAIDKSGFTDVKIVTDDMDSPVVKKLVSDGIQLLTNKAKDSARNDFRLLLNSENILISHSSYSWWAAFLGEHKKVIVPYAKGVKTMWPIEPKKDDVDLFTNLPNWVKYVK